MTFRIQVQHGMIGTFWLNIFFNASSTMYANQDVPELNGELRFQAMDTTRPESVISSFSTREEKPEWHVPPGHCFLKQCMLNVCC